MNISPPGAIVGIADVKSITPIEKPAREQLDLAGSFASALDAAHATARDATQATEQFAKGDPGMGIHEVMIASEKASISLRYATTLKNKALDAYRELMNTQV